MNYLVIGTGGVGGSIAGFLALAGREVTCIARGKHLEAIRKQGLHLKSDLKGDHFLPVKACTADSFDGKADVIFVCVKGYSIESIRDVLERAAKPDTLVIPILNVYGTGPRIGRMTPAVTVLDGCIYIVGFVSGEGEITQMGNIFRLVFGARPEQGITRERLEVIASDLRASKWMFQTTSTAIRSLNGPLFLPWPVQALTTMSRWEKYRKKVKFVTPLSDSPAKVRRSDAVWALYSRRIRSPIT